MNAKKHTISYAGVLCGLLLTAVLLLGTAACSDTFLDEVKAKIARDESTDATLKALSVSAGNMFPAFSAVTNDYYILLTSDQDTTIVTAAVNYASATLEIDGQPVSSGVPSNPIGLAPGHNSIQIEVTASDGITTRTYTVFAARAGVDLPKTGQTASYAAGDDGDLEQGISRPISRFTVDSGTITDSLTGLMWEQAPTAFTRDWEDSITYADGLVLNFHNDWRMPNRHELRSLFNYQTVDTGTWLNAQGFTGMLNGQYWTSTICRPNAFGVWALFMINGAGAVDIYPRSNTSYMIAVRDSGTPGTITLPRTGQTVKTLDYDDGYYQAGAAWPVPRFTENGNGTVTDNLTALMWEQTPSSTARNWAQALTHANDLTLAGFDDWHLPNLNELDSLYNAGVNSLCDWLETEGFENLPDPDGLIWSSTTYAPNDAYAWHLFVDPDAQNGQIYYQPKTSAGNATYPYRAWAVRSGR